MKKFCFYVALSILTCAASCQREELAVPESDEHPIKVYATLEDVTDTKTYMDEKLMLWSSGDQIAVFLKNTLRKRFTVTPESVGGQDATFQMDDAYAITGTNSTILKNVAYYPFCDVVCEPDGARYKLSNIILPSVQSYAVSSVGPGAYPMVAVTGNIDDENYNFKNICGALMFQLKGFGYIKSVAVKGNSDEILAGPASVTAAHGALPAVALADGGSGVVTLDCGEGVELNAENPVSFIIALPPVPFEGGFTITVTDTWGGSQEYSTSKKNPILRSTILKMPPKEYIGIKPPQKDDYIDEYGINHGQGVEIDGVVWAPVNCGYKAPTSKSRGFPYGKLYQWGRKYGQLYDGELYVGGSSIDTVTDSGELLIDAGPVSLNVGQSKNYSISYYTSNGSNNNDWLYPREDMLWNSGTKSAPKKTEYDPCPDGWRVPTYAELKSLKSNYSSWTTNDLEQSGLWFSGTTSYTPDSPKIFLPAAGSRYPCAGVNAGKASLRGLNGYYWSSDISGTNAVYLSLGKTTATVYGGYRAYGYSVRCVLDDSELISVGLVTLDKTSVTMIVGQTQTITATITPSNANHQAAHWWSEDESVATVDSKGNITAVSEGTVTVTAMAGMQTATCEIVVTAGKKYVDEYGVDQGLGVEIDGIVWAPVNCGYHKTDFPYGKYYQWGRKFGQGYIPNWMNGPVGESALLDEKYADLFFWASYGIPFDWYYYNDSTLWNSGTEDSPVKTQYDPCPEGWRVPTYTELCNLSAYRSSAMTEKDGQKGYWFKGSGENAVFLPAAGFIYYDVSPDDQGVAGCYWSSTPYPPYLSLRYSFSRTNENDYCRGNGFSVRCVAE